MATCEAHLLSGDILSCERRYGLIEHLVLSWWLTVNEPGLAFAPRPRPPRKKVSKSPHRDPAMTSVLLCLCATQFWRFGKPHSRFESFLWASNDLMGSWSA